MTKKRIRKKKTKSINLDWGPVKVTRGVHAGRIGYFDDTELPKGIVYFGDCFYAPCYHLIPIHYLAPITTDDLMTRYGELFRLIGLPNRNEPYGKLATAEEHIEHLSEYAFVQAQLMERIYVARFSQGSGKKIFISHSSKDKQFATWLSVDLANRGHDPWLDEWKIRAGESIPTKIGEGLQQCDFIVVVLSEHATSSNWVEHEWQTKYWSEVSSGKVSVIPALLRPCQIPFLLQMKKYADFTKGYNYGLEDILLAVRSSALTETLGPA